MSFETPLVVVVVGGRRFMFQVANKKHLRAKLLCPSEFSHSQTVKRCILCQEAGKTLVLPHDLQQRYCHDFLIQGSAAMNSAAAQTPTLLGSELLLDMEDKTKIPGGSENGVQYPQNQGFKCFNTKTL